MTSSQHRAAVVGDGDVPASSTRSPSRGTANRSSSARSRGSGSSAISALAASIRKRRLGGARRRPAPQPGQLLAQQPLAALLAHAPRALALGAGQHVRRVAALVAVHVAVGDLPRRRADRVEEPAVVGDDQQRAAAGGEVARQPVDGLDVEVVGGLVEQQQLGLVEQRRGERDPPPLAAATAAPTGVSRPCGKRASSTPPSRPSSTRGSARRPPTRDRRARRRAARGWCRAASRSSPWPSSTERRGRRRASPRPRRASSAPAISRSSVDLPSPLRPTTPIRSPAETPSVTSRSTESPASTPSVTSCSTLRVP